MVKYLIVLSVVINTFCLSMLSHGADKNIGVLVFDGVLTSDVTAPIEVFGMASRHSWFSDYNVIAINVKDGEYVTTNEGLVIKTQSHIGLNPKLDVLIVPSSYEMGPLIKNESLISFIKRTAQSADWMASHCSGAQLMAKAGLLKGKNATTWAGGESSFKRAFPEVNVVFDQNVVVDGNVMTSNGGVVTYEASLELLKHIAGKGKAKEVSEALQFNRISSSSNF